MNERIDVLAVLRKHAASNLARANMGEKFSEEAFELVAAALAVAELIEATKDFVEVRTHNGPRMHYDPVQSERLFAALARVGGA